jgi:hypothetical protein
VALTATLRASDSAVRKPGAIESHGSEQRDPRALPGAFGLGELLLGRQKWQDERLDGQPAVRVLASAVLRAMVHATSAERARHVKPPAARKRAPAVGPREERSAGGGQGVTRRSGPPRPEPRGGPAAPVAGDARNVRGERAELKTTAARASRSAGTAAGRLASVSTPGSDGRNAAHSPPSVPPMTSSPTVTLPRVRGLMAQVRRRISPGRYAAAGAGQPRDTQQAAAELAAWVPGRSVDLCLCKTPGQDRLAALLLLARLR